MAIITKVVPEELKRENLTRQKRKRRRSKLRLFSNPFLKMLKILQHRDRKKLRQISKLICTLILELALQICLKQLLRASISLKQLRMKNMVGDGNALKVAINVNIVISFQRDTSSHLKLKEMLQRRRQRKKHKIHRP